MKTNMVDIRKTVCKFLLHYRSLYNDYRKLTFITEYVVEDMCYHYRTIKLLRYMGFISFDTLKRSYLMLSTIRKGLYK